MIIEFTSGRRKTIVKRLAKEFEIDSKFIDEKLGNLIDNTPKHDINYYRGCLDLILVKESSNNGN